MVSNSGLNMTANEWDIFISTKFIGKFADQASDFQSWLRIGDFCYLDFDILYMDKLFIEWSRSKRRGKHTAIMDRKRREKFGPGRYWAATSSGVFLNKQFVKGWRGINPSNP